MTVFISHSSKDVASYTLLGMVLDGARIDRWDVTTMSRGASIADQLRTAINTCKTCVFIATRSSVESQWCLAELGAFWGAGKRVILFMVDPDLDKSALPAQFRENLHATSATQVIEAIRESESRIAAGLPNFFCEVIDSREELYSRCTQLIKSSKDIRDTTWGKRAPAPQASAEKTRVEYRAAVDAHIKDGKFYQELLTSEGREEYIEESALLKETYKGNYECRVLQVDISELSMLEMMIGDTKRIIFSHVNTYDRAQGIQYLYCESEPLAKIFLQFYADTWSRSTDLQKFEANRKKKLKNKNKSDLKSTVGFKTEDTSSATGLPMTS